VVEQLAANGGDEALRDPVLPWAAEAGPDGLDAHGPECGDDLGAEAPGAVEEQVPGHVVEGEGLSKLLDDPGCSRVRRHAKPGHLPATMADDEEDLQDAEGCRGDGEKVHGGDALAMVLRERPPAPAGPGWAWKGAQAARDAALRDIDVEP